ncbi:MAG: hypothetical protein NC453_10175 [Muribaculum sp.]|nr:hypothetical protein [Muribaculum sp.]
MLKITAKIRPDSDEVKVGWLVVLVDDGNEVCEIQTDVHCEPCEMLLFHMPQTMHIIKHLYSIAEDFHRRNLPYVSDLIVKRFHKTYNQQFNAEKVERFKMDSNIAEVLIITT